MPLGWKIKILNMTGNIGIMENTGVEVAFSKLEDVLEEHERVIVAGAPRIYRYETLRELAERRRAVFAEKPKELLREKSDGREVVIADFYGFFKDYRSLGEKDREEVRKKLSRASRACISLRLYELLWLVYEHPGELEKLCGELRDWKGALLSVAEEEAEEVLRKGAKERGVKGEIEDFVKKGMNLLKRKKYEKSFKDIENLVKSVVKDKNERNRIINIFKDIFGDEIEKDGEKRGFWKYKYVSWLPGLVLIKDVARIESIERFFELLAGGGISQTPCEGGQRVCCRYVAGHCYKVCSQRN
jgi:hypothetical protein